MKKTLFSILVFLLSMSNIPMFVISGNVDRRSNVVIEYGDANTKPGYVCEFSVDPEAQKFQTYSNKNGYYIIVVPKSWSGVVIPQPIVRRHNHHRALRVLNWYTPCLEYRDVAENHLWQNYIIDDGKPKW
jgi:hypothetical protein